MINFTETWLDLRVTLSLACVIIVAILVHVKKRKRQNYNFPSGPSGIPIGGNFLSLIREPIHLKLSEWAYKFGKLYTIHLGPKSALVVNDVATMKEIFGIYPASTGKLLTDMFTYPFGGKYGLLCVDGQHWQEQRNFCIKNLRNLGFGKGATMEPMLIDEANDLVAWLGQEVAKGQPVQIFAGLQNATFNALWTLVTGEKIPQGDTRFVDLMQGWLAAVQRATKTGLAFLPWLKYVAPERSGFNMFHNMATMFNQFIGEYLAEHQKTFQGSSRDLIDDLLEQMKREKEPGSSFYGEEGWKHSVGTIVTLYLGGGETTATTLMWLIFYLCCDKRVQGKLQEEIDREIGRDLEATLNDKFSMPYTEAVILETLRKSTFFPIGIIHELTEDVRFQNYLLPKKTLLIANIYHVHHDTKIWDDPENFRPERFLIEDKSLRENVVGFQVGKRHCLGEALAKDIMFLFVTKMFQKFTFSTDPSHQNKEYLEPEIGYCLATKHLPIVVSCRDDTRS